MYNSEINPNEAQYLEQLQKVFTLGTRQKNRTGIDTFMIPGGMMQFDMAKGFPAVTTKKFAMDACKGELIGFLRGYTSAKQFRDLGCNIWDQNANENEAWLANEHRTGPDDLGYIYSRLWTDMPGGGAQYLMEDKNDDVPFKLVYQKWDQIARLIDGIKTDPTSRRLIVNAWHPEVFGKAALPPCHVMFQIIIEQETKKMHMLMYQRSCDFFLGVPFNIASYSMLLEILAKFTGYTSGTLTWFGADCHIYENHMAQVAEQLSRDPMAPPILRVNIGKALVANSLAAIDPFDIQLEGYTSHPAIRAPMAV